MSRFEGQRIIVTGAASGFGEAIARRFAAEGGRVLLGDLNAAGAETVAESIAAAGGSALALGVNVAEEAEVEAMIGRAVEELGGVDVLVNNAGITEVVPAEEEPLESFERVIGTNLTGAFLCTQRFGRPMLAAGSGSVVNVASILGLVASGQIPQVGYASAKGGMINMTREFAAQWARRGVRVNGLAPAWFDTEMTVDMFGDERSERWMRGRTPMGRAGRVEELVGPLLFLASDAASYVTGQTLAVDGGWTIV